MELKFFHSPEKKQQNKNLFMSFSECIELVYSNANYIKYRIYGMAIFTSPPQVHI